MELYYIIVLIATFLFSFSVLLNFILGLAVAGIGWYSLNSFKNSQLLEQQIVELNSQLLVSDSVDEIIDHILGLQEILHEIAGMNIYTGEPTIEELRTQVNNTLQKIQTSVVAHEYERAIENLNE